MPRHVIVRPPSARRYFDGQNRHFGFAANQGNTDATDFDVLNGYGDRGDVASRGDDVPRGAGGGWFACRSEAASATCRNLCRYSSVFDERLGRPCTIGVGYGPGGPAAITWQLGGGLGSRDGRCDVACEVEAVTDMPTTPGGFMTDGVNFRYDQPLKPASCEPWSFLSAPHGRNFSRHCDLNCMAEGQGGHGRSQIYDDRRFPNSRLRELAESGANPYCWPLKRPARK